MPERASRASVVLHQQRVARVDLVTVLVLLLLTGALLYRGLDFYVQDVHDRVAHPDFRVLSPGEIVGHGYGIVGTGLIFTNLLYLARRRFAAFQQFGSMRTWLNVHVFTGLAGSVLIAFHSAFQLRTPIATFTSVTLFFVVLSGLIGRYLHSLAPQANRPRFLDALAELDFHAPGAGARLKDVVAALPPAAEPRRATLLDALLTIPTWRAQVRVRRERMQAALSDLVRHSLAPEASRGPLQQLCDEVVKLAAEPVRTYGAECLLRSWRSVHRFAALLMIVSVSVHIVVAWVLGFRWIWSS